MKLDMFNYWSGRVSAQVGSSTAVRKGDRWRDRKRERRSECRCALKQQQSGSERRRYKGKEGRRE